MSHRDCYQYAIAAQIMLRLQTAMEEMEALTALLDDEEETETALVEEKFN